MSMTATPTNIRSSPPTVHYILFFSLFPSITDPDSNATEHFSTGNVDVGGPEWAYHIDGYALIAYIEY